MAHLSFSARTRHADDICGSGATSGVCRIQCLCLSVCVADHAHHKRMNFAQRALANLTRNKLDITMQQSVLAKFSYTAPIVIGCSIQESHFVDQCQKSDKQTYTQDQATSWSHLCCIAFGNVCEANAQTTMSVWTYCCTLEWDHPLHCITAALIHVTDECICMTESANWGISHNNHRISLIMRQSLLTLQYCTARQTREWTMGVQDSSVTLGSEVV